MKKWAATVFLLLGLNAGAVAEDALSAWATGFEQPEVQQQIVSKIFSGQLGSIAEAKRSKNGTYFFLKNNSWVRLGGSIVHSSFSATGPYLVVSCMLYRDVTREPVSATSYLFRDPFQRAIPISGGYAQHEEVRLVKLSKLKKSFLVLLGSSNYGQETGGQWSASLVDIEANTGGSARAVWNSPQSARSFRFGFNDLAGNVEELVLRVNKGGELRYSAYRWNGSRFESDSFALENRLKSLPGEVWQYGSSG